MLPWLSAVKLYSPSSLPNASPPQAPLSWVAVCFDAFVPCSSPVPILAGQTWACRHTLSSSAGSAGPSHGYGELFPGIQQLLACWCVACASMSSVESRSFPPRCSALLPFTGSNPALPAEAVHKRWSCCLLLCMCFALQLWNPTVLMLSSYEFRWGYVKNPPLLEKLQGPYTKEWQVNNNAVTKRFGKGV